jgi:hypothetical protein
MGERTDGTACRRRGADGLPPPRFLAVHGYDPRPESVAGLLGLRKRAVAGLEIKEGIEMVTR